MKCPNCGADVSIYDLKCPYCETENPEGIAFQEKMIAKRKQNEAMKAKTRQDMVMPVTTLWVKRIFRTMVAVLILQLVLMMVGGLFLVGPYAIGKRPKDYKAQLKAIYDSGNYEQLDHIFFDWNLNSDDYPVYYQAGEMYQDYSRFMERAFACNQAIEQGHFPDSYDLSYALQLGSRLLNEDSYYGQPVFDENSEFYSEYCETARLFLSGTLRLTDAELAELSEIDYLYGEDRDDYMQKITLRLARELDAEGEEISEETDEEADHEE